MDRLKITILVSLLLPVFSGFGYGQEQKSIPSTNEIRALLSDAERKNEGNKAIIELSKIENSIYPSLIEILQDKNESHYVRTYAMSVLVMAKDLRAVEPLIEYINDDDWLIRDGALTSLNYITRNFFGGDKKAWKEWWAKALPKYLHSVGDCSKPEVKKTRNEEPCWIIDKIAREEMGSPASPPASISKCIYRNQIVYYEPPRCCDIPSILWDEIGKKVCSPDGGLTGLGDRKCSDFFSEKKDCVIIWRDSRSSR